MAAVRFSICRLLGIAIFRRGLRINILKCEFFTHFGSFVLKLHDVSTSHLEALVTGFLSQETS